MADIAGYLINQGSANCLASLIRVFIGVLVATIFGITAGLLRSALPSRLKRNKVIRFFFEAPKFPPPIAWIPFVILAFGIGELSAYTVVFIGAFAPIFTNTYEAAESVPEILRKAALSLDATGWRYMAQVIFPASLPQIFTGIRVGMAMGWMSVIAAEMVSGQSGLGYSIQINRLNLQHTYMVIDMVLISLIGFLLFESIVFLERICIPWHERSQRLSKEIAKQFI